MRHRGGWIKIHRSIFQHWLGQDDNAFKVWIWLLINSNYEPSKLRNGEKIKVIHRGELITSLREIAAAVHFDVKTVKRVLVSMKNDEMIDFKMDHQGTHITILNYSKYQDIDSETSTPKGTPKGTPSPHQRDHDGITERIHMEEVKKVKKEKKERSKEGVPSGVISSPPSDPLIPTTQSKVWKKYSDAYRKTYNVEPVRNAMVNSQITNLVKRIGEDAPSVAEFFLSHRNKFYVQKMHPVGLLLADAEKLHSEWKLGIQMTSKMADRVDTESTIDLTFRQFMENGNER